MPRRLSAELVELVTSSLRPVLDADIAKVTEEIQRTVANRDMAIQSLAYLDGELARLRKIEEELDLWTGDV